MNQANSAYVLGVLSAYQKLGMHEQNRQLASEQLTGDSLGPGGNSAEQFTEFVKKDDTEEALLHPAQVNPNYDKPVHWSGRSSLDSGDAGTRQNEMGLPRFNGV